MGPVGTAPFAERANATHDAASDATSSVSNMCGSLEQIIAHLTDGRDGLRCGASQGEKSM